MSRSVQLARAKLSLPPPRPEHISRPNLIAKLEEGYNVPVTLIAAPAGFGKTTLLAEWLSRFSHRAAWLSLGEHDDNLSLFASYLIAAIQTVFPRSLRTLSRSLGSVVSSSPSQLAAAFGNAIAELPEEFVLVLDDYHLVNNDQVHELMSELVQNMPALLHLVISTRAAVALPFGKLRARHQLFELRAEDLSFRVEETRAYLNLALGNVLSDELVQRIQYRTQGWAVALSFASILSRERKFASTTIERVLNESNQQLMDYLLEQVLSKRSSSVREFMLKTALVERFPAALAEAMVGPQEKNSYEILDELVRDNLVTFELVENERWYKYLDLFREFLQTEARTRLATQAIHQTHQGASRWLRERGLIVEAIQQSIAAGEMPEAAHIVGENILPVMDREIAVPLIRSWLELFAPQVIEQQPELLMARAWLLVIAFQMAPVPPLLTRIQELVAKSTDLDPATVHRLRGEIAYLRIFSGIYLNEPKRVLEIVQEHADALPTESGHVRGNLLSFRAKAYHRIGELEKAFQLLADALQQDDSTSPVFTGRILLSLGDFYQWTADLPNLEQTVQKVMYPVIGQSHLNLGWGHWALGFSYYEWNRLEAAAQHFSAAAELRYATFKSGYECLAWLALTQQAQGANAAANTSMEQLFAFAAESRLGTLQHDAEAYRARLMLLQGNLDASLRWAQSVALIPNPNMLFEIEPHLTRLQILLATGKPTLIHTMLEETNTLLAQAQAGYDTRRVIQLYALQALARSALGNRSLALDSLEQAIQLAEPGGFVRSFLDLGGDMPRLLQQLAARGKSSAYLHRLIAEATRHAKARVVTSNDNDASLPMEPLTLRELEVMQGLAQHQTNKEIAAQLVVSPLTVKVHISHILQKLGVTNRKDAVKLALALGIV